MRQAILVLVKGSVQNGQLDFAKDTIVKALNSRGIEARTERFDCDNPAQVRVVSAAIVNFAAGNFHERQEALNNGAEHEETDGMTVKQFLKKEFWPKARKMMEEVWHPPEPEKKKPDQA